MYFLYVTAQCCCCCCCYFEQSGTCLWESQVSQQTDNLMVQMWTNLVRFRTISHICTNIVTAPSSMKTTSFCIYLFCHSSVNILSSSSLLKFHCMSCTMMIKAFFSILNLSFVSFSCSPQMASVTLTTVERSLRCRVQLR